MRHIYLITKVPKKLKQITILQLLKFISLKYQIYTYNYFIINISTKVEMLSQEDYTYPLSPYKTLGVFVDGPVAVSQVAPYNIAAACDKSFKIYSQDLAIKVVSPAFPQKIKAIATYNECTYVYCGSTVYKMQYCHLTYKWEIPVSQSNNKSQKNSDNYCKMMLFDSLIILQQLNKIHIITQNSQILKTLQYSFKITQTIHPVTYINKLLIANCTNLLLINPISQKIIYTFKNTLQKVIMSQKQTEIDWLKETPLTDVVAVGLKNSNQILIVNIKKDCVVFAMKQKNRITAVGFDGSEPFMGTGDVCGNIILWDLQNRRIVYRFQEAFDGKAISHLSFNMAAPLITVMSSQDNSLKQYRINIEDSKTLSLYRERCASTESISHIYIANNKQLCYYGTDSMVYSSLYTHTNNYKLPNIPNNNNKLGYYKVLNSNLPYHIVAHNFKISLYKERSIYAQGIIAHKEYATSAIMSISGYVLATTKTKVLKLRLNKPLSQKQQKQKNARSIGKLETILQWQVDNVQSLQIYNEQYVFMFKKDDGIYVYQFGSADFVTCINGGWQCSNGVLNCSRNLMAFGVSGDIQGVRVQVWDMGLLRCGRRFMYSEDQKEEVMCLAFTPDNRYLLGSLSSKKLVIWSILDNIIYQTIPLQSPIKSMAFTPDGSYLLSAYLHSKQLQIWNNYIGKVVTSITQPNTLRFTPKIKSLPADYRHKLAQQEMKIEQQISSLSVGEEFMKLLEDVEVEEDQGVEYYGFEGISRWLPLVYYDEIRERNAIEGNNQQLTGKSGIPFFLDFSHLTEQKQKLHKELRQELLQKKKQQTEKRDILLKDDQNTLYFSTEASQLPKNYLQNYKKMVGMSVAAVDYQLRRYLMSNQNNYENMTNMFIYVYENYVQHCCETEIGNAMLYNILLKRYLDLMGTDICREELKGANKKLLGITRLRYEELEELVYKDTAILENRKIN